MQHITMKKIILSMAVSLFICACTAKTELKTTRRTPIDSLVGNWIYYQYNGKHSDTNQTFHLVLKKTKQDTVVGYYCSTWNSGNRIDCSTENVNNIKGVFKKDTLYLSYYGFYDDDARGNAKVYKQKNGDVIWKLMECKGVFYLPEMVLLTHYNADKFHAEINAIDSLKEREVVVGIQTEVSIEKISLPFDFYQFQKEQELYDMGEQDEMSYHPTSIEGNKELEYTYKSRWDKSLPSLFYRIKTGKKYQLDLVCYYLENTPSLIYRLITSVNENVIDGVTVFSQIGENNRDWKTNSFTISKNLDITVYKNKLHKDKVIKKDVVDRYTIDDKGRFIKQ